MKGQVVPKASTSLDVLPLSLLHLAFIFSLQQASQPEFVVSSSNSFGMYIFMLLFYVVFFFNSLCVIHIYFLIFYISLIQFCLSLWLVACWIAFCQKDSNEAAFFRLTDEEKSTFFETICFFSNEWIHRMDTRLLRSDKWWTGGISSTYLNAENSPEK